MGINFSMFNKVMTSQFASSKEIPGVSFNPTSSLGMAIDRLSSNINTEGSIEEIITQLSKNFNDPIFRNESAVVKDIILSSTNSIVNSFNMLGFIKDSVDTLKAKIEKETNEIASHSEVITQANVISTESYKTEFSTIPWEDVNKLGSQVFVVEQLQGTLGVFSETPSVNISFNNTNLTILFNSFSRYMDGEEFESVAYSEEQYEKITAYCHEKTDITKDNISRCLKTIFEKERLVRWINNSLVRVDRPDIITTIEDINDICMLDKVISAVEKNINDVCNFTNEQAMVLDKNIKLVTDTLYFKYFFVNCQRNLNKERLIFDSHLINPDALVDFRKAGYDVDDISKFIYRRMQNNQPYKGITTEAIKASIENVRGELQRNKESLNRLATLELNDIRKRSFIRNMNEFMDKLVEEPKISNIPRYILHMADDVNYLNGDLESAIYGVIINAEFPNTFVQTMYEKLGKAYMNVLSNNKDISQEDMNEAEINTILSIVTEHIVDKLVEEIK